ncbi:hypothetical protein HNR29_001987 [Rhizobium leguminosarum]|nr:hypothetical protein [Rhizobium leguminosarum]
MPDISDDCCSDVVTQRHSRLSSSLSVYKDRARLPVDIVKIEGCHFAGAQTELGEDHQSRIVPTTHCHRPITGIENLLDLLERRRDEAFQMQIAQEGTHNPAHGFATVGGTVERMSLDNL